MQTNNVNKAFWRSKMARDMNKLKTDINIICKWIMPIKYLEKLEIETLLEF